MELSFRNEPAWKVSRAIPERPSESSFQKDIDDVEAYECNDSVQQEVDQLLMKFKDL